MTAKLDLITYRGTVYPWHCDHIGHMNVMWYVGKFDEATWHFFANLGLTPTYLRDSQRGMAAVQQNISYKREVMAGDIVEIASGLLEIRDKVVRFQHDMHNAENGEVVCSCELTAMHLDRRIRKSTAFEADIRAKAEKLLVAPD